MLVELLELAQGRVLAGRGGAGGSELGVAGLFGLVGLVGGGRSAFGGGCGVLRLLLLFWRGGRWDQFLCWFFLSFTQIHLKICQLLPLLHPKLPIRKNPLFFTLGLHFQHSLFIQFPKTGIFYITATSFRPFPGLF